MIFSDSDLLEESPGVIDMISEDYRTTNNEAKIEGPSEFPFSRSSILLSSGHSSRVDWLFLGNPFPPPLFFAGVAASGDLYHQPNLYLASGEKARQ